MPKFSFDGGVVAIGSGSGGGTLADELRKKDIEVVMLEAGALQSTASFIDDADGYSIEIVGPKRPKALGR